jgi:predicted nucleic acid-binding protein
MHLLTTLPQLHVAYLSHALLADAIALYRKKASIRISVVDINNVILMQSFGLTTIFSFDIQFFTLFKLSVVPEL